MSWKVELEKLLRDQMRYAWVDGETEKSFDPEEDSFQEALGYVLDNVECLMKKSYFEGYASGVVDCASDLGDAKADFVFDKDISRVGAERAWLKWEQQ